MIENILVVVDPTATSHPCVDKAARIAQGFGSTLELFIGDVEQGGGSTFLDYRKNLRERRLATLETLAAPLRARGIHVRTESQWHVPLEQVGAVSTASQVLEQTDCDLLVMTPEGFVSPALVTRG